MIWKWLGDLPEVHMPFPESATAFMLHRVIGLTTAKFQYRCKRPEIVRWAEPEDGPLPAGMQTD